MATQVGPSVPPNNKKNPTPGSVRQDQYKYKDQAPLKGIKNPGLKKNAGVGVVTRSGSKRGK